MTYSREKFCSFTLPAAVGAVLLALSAAAGPAGASARAPLSPSIGSTGGLTAVLFKYEDLFGRSAAPPKNFKQIDIDGSRTLLPEELQRAFGSRWQSVFKRLDLNADGRVTPEEVRSSGSFAGERSNGRQEQRSGTRSGDTAGTRGKSQGAKLDRSNGGKGSENRGGVGNRGHDKGSGKADRRGGAAGNGGGSGANRGRN